MPGKGWRVGWGWAGEGKKEQVIFAFLTLKKCRLDSQPLASSICFGLELAAEALSAAAGREGRRRLVGEAAPWRREGLSPLRAPPKGALPPLRRRAPPLLIHCLDKSILRGRSQAPPAPSSSSSSPSSVWGVAHLSAAGKAGARPPGLGIAALGHLWGRRELGRSRPWGWTDCQSRWLRGGDGARPRPAWRDSPERVGARGRVHSCVPELREGARVRGHAAKMEVGEPGGRYTRRPLPRMGVFGVAVGGRVG